MASLLEGAVRLPGYQKRWVQDRSRFKVGRLARQTGKSFMLTLEAAFDMAEAGAPWVLLSSGERASRALGEKLQMHLRGIGAAAEALEGEDVFGGSTFKVHEIRLSNGARAICLPANPDTARGHSANVGLDEFAFHRDSRKIWTALFPTITRGFKLRVTSTPQGKQNKFYELANNREYSQHVVTIYDAIAAGLELRDENAQPTTPEQLRAALGDDEAFEQEYMVVFLDEVSAWLAYELIAECEDATLEMTPAWATELLEAAVRAHADAPDKTRVEPVADVALPAIADELFLGLDIARRRDLTAIYVLARRGQLDETLAVIPMQKQPFGVQERVLWTLLERLPVRRGCIDQTGLGMQLAERARERFGEFRVEGIDFTPANKEVLAGALKRSFQDRRIRVPAERVVRESLHSLKRFETATGHFRFDAERTETTGHADMAWACALALQAGSSGIAAADVGDSEEPAAPVGVGQRLGRGLLSFWGRRTA